MSDPRADPARYGASFAEVYDSWYPGGDEAAIVSFLGERLAAGASVLELGAGTGRIAVPLAAAGFRVTGVDASAEMLRRLAEKDPSASVGTALADAADPGTWPLQTGGYDCVLAACNLLLNLVGPGAQEACVKGVANALEPGGIFVAELSQVRAPDGPTKRIEVSAVKTDAVVLIATDADPESGLVTGNHIELRDGEPVVLRPWSIRLLTVQQLDAWCADVGLEPVRRHDGYCDAAAEPDDPVSVSVYRRT